MASVTRKSHNPFVLKLINPIVRAMLTRGKGPTKEMMLLAWEGRKSGRSFSTPVSRFEVDGRLLTSTSAGWRWNFVDGHMADVTVDGEERRVSGTIISDPDAVGDGLRAIIDGMGVKAAQRALALAIEGEPTVDELSEFAAADGLNLIEFTPTD